MRVAGVALGARRRVPLAVAGDRHRVDREHLVAGGPQRDPRATVSLDPDHDPVGDLVQGQLRPVVGGVLSQQRVQPGDALQPLGQPGPRQHPAVLVLHLHIVMIFRPVVADEQHRVPPQLVAPQWSVASTLPPRPNDQVLAHEVGTASHQRFRTFTASARTVCQ